MSPKETLFSDESRFFQQSERRPKPERRFYEGGAIPTEHVFADGKPDKIQLHLKVRGLVLAQ